MYFRPSHLSSLFSLLAIGRAQLDWGYDGYSLSTSGDPESVSYSTLNTPANNATLAGPPDVFLNASVGVGFIGIEVKNLSAKINIDAQVLDLLKFNAGVDLNIDRVKLTIEKVEARVKLQARLGNLLLMVGDVLDSIDLNPIIAELGQSVSDITDSVGDVLTGATSGLAARDLDGSYRLKNNILYSVNDYSGSAHTNRVLAQTGDIVDQELDASGNIKAVKVVGHFEETMVFTGQNRSVVHNGADAFELEYTYAPFPGLQKVASIFVNLAGDVLGTQVISEAVGGGSSSISKN